MDDTPCETLGCRGIATHIYGPKCCGETDGLMYLCAKHAAAIGNWLLAHASDQYVCKKHGAGGRVKDAVYLGRM